MKKIRSQVRLMNEQHNITIELSDLSLLTKKEQLDKLKDRLMVLRMSLIDCEDDIKALN